MKTKIFLLLFSAILFSAEIPKSTPETKQHFLVTDYCDGWEDGYCEGWKDVKGEFSICPVTPVCPVPLPAKDTYRDGYNRGFKAGYRAAENSPY